MNTMNTSKSKTTIDLRDRSLNEREHLLPNREQHHPVQEKPRAGNWKISNRIVAIGAISIGIVAVATNNNSTTKASFASVPSASSSSARAQSSSIDGMFQKGTALASLGVADQLEIMKEVIVETCGKQALVEYAKEYEGEGERSDKKQFAKADAFLSKLSKAREMDTGAEKREEDSEDVDIDATKNTDKFLRAFNDMQKAVKQTKKYANADEEESMDADDLERGFDDNSGARSRTVVEAEDAKRDAKKISKSLIVDDDDESSNNKPREKLYSRDERRESSESRDDGENDNNSRGGREKLQERHPSKYDDEETEEDRRPSTTTTRSSSSSNSRRYDDERDVEDKSRYASKVNRRMLLATAEQTTTTTNDIDVPEPIEVAEEEIKHTGVFALLQKMVGTYDDANAPDSMSSDPVKTGKLPQLGLPQMGARSKAKKALAAKKPSINNKQTAGLGKSMGVAVVEEDDDETSTLSSSEIPEEKEAQAASEAPQVESRTDKVLKIALDGEKSLERDAIEKVYKGSSSSKKKSALEIQRSDLTETDEQAFEAANSAADKYYDVSKVERLALETLKEHMGKGEASMGKGEQLINTKALEEAIGRAANQSPEVTRQELFSTLGRKAKEEFINAARLKKLVELKQIATTCKPTLSDGGKAMERAKEAAQQAAMKVKQAAARRAEAEANYEHSQEVAKIAAQKVDDITELAQKKIQEVQEVAKRKVQNAKDISRLAGRKVEDEFDMLGKSKEDFNLHVQHAMKAVESAKESAAQALEETKTKSQTAKQRSAALEVSLAKEYEEARTAREIEEKKLAKAEAQAEAAETEREQKVLEAHQRQMEIEKVAKERQYKLEEEQRQMEFAKKRALAKSTQYRTSAEDALQKLSVIDFDNKSSSDDSNNGIASIGYGEEVAYPSYETEEAMGSMTDSSDGFDPWTK